MNISAILRYVFQSYSYRLNAFPWNLYVEILTANVTVLENRAFGRWCHEGGALMSGLGDGIKASQRKTSTLWFQSYVKSNEQNELTNKKSNRLIDRAGWQQLGEG